MIGNLKVKIITYLTGRFGKILTPLIAGFMGTSIATLYIYLGSILHKYPSIENFLSDVWNNLDIDTKMAFDPKIIGTAIAIATYGIIQEALNSYFVKSNKKDQEELNKVIDAIEQTKAEYIEKGELPKPEREKERLLVDGVPGPKTAKIKKEINVAAKIVLQNMLKR